MLRRFCALSLLLNSLVAAQRENDFPDGPSGVDNATVAAMTHMEGEILVHTVHVGFNSYAPAFFPNSISANPDDKISFIFHSGNHSVIQSLYQWPCVPRTAVDGTNGFNSGKLITSAKPHMGDVLMKSTGFFPVNDTNAEVSLCYDGSPMLFDASMSAFRPSLANEPGSLYQCGT